MLAVICMRGLAGTKPKFPKKNKIEFTVWAGRIHAPLFVHPDKKIRIPKGH